MTSFTTLTTWIIEYFTLTTSGRVTDASMALSTQAQSNDLLLNIPEPMDADINQRVILHALQHDFLHQKLHHKHLFHQLALQR